MSKKRIVFATHNPHKVEEIRQMLGEEWEVCLPTDLGLHEEIPEDFDTLEANSLQKAEFVRAATKLDCFADDTGLEVEILGGAPGVYSARYAGEQCSYADNCAKLLRELQGKSHRTARFRTVVTLIWKGNRKQFEGIVDGEILTAPQGGEGFGYDPIFRPLGYFESFAEMSAEQKNSLSHRGRAMRKMVDYLISES